MRVLCLLLMQDLKYKILVKGKKEHVAQKCSSSSSDLSSSEEEAGCAEVKPSGKKECKKVKTQGSLSQEQFSFYIVWTFHDNFKKKFEKTPKQNGFLCGLSQVCPSWARSCQNWWCTPAVFPLKALNKQPKVQQLTCPLSLKVKLSDSLRIQVRKWHIISMMSYD